jgi:hypothetical protein
MNVWLTPFIPVIIFKTVEIGYYSCQNTFRLVLKRSENIEYDAASLPLTHTSLWNVPAKESLIFIN